MAKVDNMDEVRRWSPTHEMAGSHLGQYILYSDHQQAIDSLRAEVADLQESLDRLHNHAEQSYMARRGAEAEVADLRRLCADMLPVFEAARPLVLNLERLRDDALARERSAMRERGE